MASLRPIPMRPSTSQMNPTTGRSFPASASGISMRCASMPLSARWLRIASAVCASTGWCRIATRCRPPSSSPSSPSSPVPITTGYGGSTATCTVTGAGWVLSCGSAVPPAAGRVCGSFGSVVCSRVEPGHDVAHHCPGVAAVRVDPHASRRVGTAEPVAIIRARYFSARSRPASRGARRCRRCAAPLRPPDLQVDDGVAGQRIAHPGAGDRAAAERHDAVWSASAARTTSSSMRRNSCSPSVAKMSAMVRPVRSSISTSVSSSRRPSPWPADARWSTCPSRAIRPVPPWVSRCAYPDALARAAGVSCSATARR